MVDTSTRTIQRLFEQQVRKLTKQSIMSKEESFDFQLSGGWLR